MYVCMYAYVHVCMYALVSFNMYVYWSARISDHVVASNTYFCLRLLSILGAWVWVEFPLTCYGESEEELGFVRLIGRPESLGAGERFEEVAHHVDLRLLETLGLAPDNWILK